MSREATITREKLSQAEENYARQLTDEANKQGLDKLRQRTVR